MEPLGKLRAIQSPAPADIRLPSLSFFTSGMEISAALPVEGALGLRAVMLGGPGRGSHGTQGSDAGWSRESLLNSPCSTKCIARCVASAHFPTLDCPRKTLLAE